MTTTNASSGQPEQHHAPGTGANGFAQYLGIETLESREGFVRLRLPVRPDLLNGHGTVHGGVLASLVDNAVGAALATLPQLGEGDGMVTTDLNISYLNPARGPVVFAEGQILEPGKSISFGEAELKDESGELVAKGRATFKVVHRG